MSPRPLTLAEAEARGLSAADGAGISTFPNGTSWHCWADGNCLRCRYYDDEAAGALCAFEGAALLGRVSPDLARLFGWRQTTDRYGPRSGWAAPERCPCYRARYDDEGREVPIPPDPDPAQLNLLADPTEDAAVFVAVEETVG